MVHLNCILIPSFKKKNLGQNVGAARSSTQAVHLSSRSQPHRPSLACPINGCALRRKSVGGNWQPSAAWRDAAERCAGEPGAEAEAEAEAEAKACSSAGGYKLEIQSA